jgi:hypothetical protein
MDPPRLTLTVEQDGETLFSGETLSGSYAITGIEPEFVRAVELSVLWQTEGKGDENLGVHYFWRREPREGLDDIVAGNWSTVLPATPLSYHGVLFRIVWLVRLRVFVRGKDFSEERYFQLGDLPRAVRVESIQATKKPIAAEILGSAEE